MAHLVMSIQWKYTQLVIKKIKFADCKVTDAFKQRIQENKKYLNVASSHTLSENSFSRFNPTSESDVLCDGIRGGWFFAQDADYIRL